jgi:hypothetical protein
MSCLACDVLAGLIEPPGGTIYEDEGWVVDHSISPVALRGWSGASKWACSHEEAAAAADATRSAWN